MMAVVIGLFGGLFSSAIFVGMVNQRLRAAIQNETANLQIHNPDYTLNREIVDTIPGSQQVIAFLDKLKPVKAVTPRLKITAMVSTASTGTGILLNGIDPEKEKAVTSIWKFIPDSAGTWFGSGKDNTIVIGQKLAKKLKVRLRSKIVVSFQTIDNQVAYGAFRVEGIYKTDNTGFDETNAFVRYHSLSSLANMHDHQIHELTIALDNDNNTPAVVDTLRKTFPSLSVMGWKEILPDVGMMTDYTRVTLYIILIIILLALSFGIVNTMMMAVLERTREIGMLMAVGMSRKRVFIMIMLESIFLTLTGAIAGMVVSAFAIHHYGIHGIDMTAYAGGWGDMGFSAIIYTSLTSDYYFGLTLLVILSAILASIGPARKALKLKPVDAIRVL